MSILDLFGITNAYAAGTAAAPTTAGSLLSFLPMLLVFVVLIFFMMRPQMKRAKEHRALISALAVNDEVITAGGMLGTVAKLFDNFVVLKISNDVEITLQRNSISQVLPKGTIDSIK
jgi:preprotein translocase subunit YajC